MLNNFIKRLDRLFLIFISGILLLTNGCSAMEKTDLIVYGRYVVTMTGDDKIIENGAVAVRDGVIVAVGTAAEIDAAYTADKTIAGENRILMPGLINGHAHSAMTLFRGIADDLPLMDWLTGYIFPLEGQFVSADFVKTGVELACLEMIKGGTTTFVDMYFYPETSAKVIEGCGMRAIIGSASIDFPSPGFEGWDDSFAAAVDFIKEWKGKNSRITPAFAPHAPYTVSPEHLKQTADMAKKLGVPVTTHVAEDRSETVTIKENYGTTPVRHVQAQGLLEVTSIFAHMVQPDDEEIAILAKSKTGVIHNPTSNLKTAAGIAPLPKMLEAGVVLGLGTDGAASNNDLNMWEEIRLAALLHKGVNHDATAAPAYAVLNMATASGAEAIGMKGKVGELKVGQRADLIQLDFDRPHLTPLYNVVSHLVYAAGADDVVTTIVDGKLLYKDGKFLTLDAAQVKADANKIADAIVKALAKDGK